MADIKSPRPFGKWLFEDLHWVFVILVPTLVIGGILYFLLTRDGGDYTGWQLLGMKGAGFWICGVLFTALGALTAVWGIRKYNMTQEVKWPMIAFVIIVIFISIAWGSGCNREVFKTKVGTIKGIK